MTAPYSIEMLKKDYKDRKWYLEFAMKDSSGRSVADGTGVTFRVSSGIVTPSIVSTEDGIVSIEVSSIDKEEVRLVVVSGTVEAAFYLNL